MGEIIVYGLRANYWVELIALRPILLGSINLLRPTQVYLCELIDFRTIHLNNFLRAKGQLVDRINWLRPTLFESINQFYPKRGSCDQLMDFRTIQPTPRPVGAGVMLFSVLRMVTWDALLLRCVGGVTSYFSAHIPIQMPPPFQILQYCWRPAPPWPNAQLGKAAKCKTTDRKKGRRGTPQNTAGRYGAWRIA